jgi:hypothetical protein
MDEFNRVVTEALSVLDNQIVSSVLGLFLVLYAGLAAPKLPRSIAKLFDNPAFRVIVLFLVAFMASKNKSVALIAAVGLVISFQTLNRHKMNDQLITAIEDQGESEAYMGEMEPVAEETAEEAAITGVMNSSEYAEVLNAEEEALYMDEEHVMNHVHAAEEEAATYGYTEDEENIAEVMGEEEVAMGVSGFGGSEFAEI